MRREQRLRRAADFAVVHRRGRNYAGGPLTLRVLRNELPVCRTGFVVGKRVGKAVVRNRVKRRLRAVVDALNLAGGYDLVLIARPEAAQRTFEALQTAVAALVRRAGIPAAQAAPQSAGAQAAP